MEDQVIETQDQEGVSAADPDAAVETEQTFAQPEDETDHDTAVANSTEDTDDAAQTNLESFAVTYKDKREALCGALPSVVDRDDEGHVVHDIYYYLCDFDDSFVYVERTEWSIESGCTEQKGRMSYTFDESARTASIDDNFEIMIVKWITAEEEAQIDAARAQYEELVEYKCRREREDREKAFDSAIEEFSYLEGNEEFNSVFENRYSYASVKELQDACYIIKGKYSISAPSRKVVTEPEIPVSSAGSMTDKDDLHHRFHARFGKK